MKIVVWVREGTWASCVDAARDLPASQVVLLHVIDPEAAEAVGGARGARLGRGRTD